VLVRNLRALPRAWWVFRTIPLGSADGLNAIRTSRLPDGSEFDPTHSAVVAPDTSRNRGDAPAAGSGTVVESDPGQHRYVVNADASGMLVLSEVYYPWWRASIDGKPAEVVRVNHAMVGVAMPRGSHVVRLSIEPTSIWIGGAITGAAVLVWSFLVIASVRVPRTAFFALRHGQR
jgi:Bacterial membrane protein YfhO